MDITNQISNLGQDELGRVIMDNEKLIYKVINDLKLYHKTADYYDIGLLAMTSSIKSYNPKYGTLSHYFYVVIRNAILNQINFEKKDVLTNGNSTFFSKIEDKIDLDKCELINPLECNINIEEDLIKKERMNIIFEVLNSKFSQQDIWIFLSHFGIISEKLTTIELAEECNLPIRTIDYKLSKIKKYLKNHFKLKGYFD